MVNDLSPDAVTEYAQGGTTAVTVNINSSESVTDLKGGTGTGPI